MHLLKRVRQSVGVLSILVVLSAFSVNKVHAQSFLSENSEAPDIMEALSMDENFVTEYSKKLGYDLSAGCNPRLVATVSDWLGVRYRRAGFSKAGIDCSGFVSKMYEEVYNISLTHSSASMIYQMKEMVSRHNLKDGDIIFFKIHGGRISHVGLYLGDNKFIHASSTRGIVVDDLRSPYYAKAYYAAGRPYFRGDQDVANGLPVDCEYTMPAEEE